MSLPLPMLYQFHFVVFFPLLSLLLFLSKFIRKRRKRFPSLAFSFAFHVYLLPFTRTCLWWYNYPARMVCGASSPTRTILWSVITHKNDFCERQPCLTRTTNSWTADLVFTNIILPSVWFVCCNVFQEHRKEGVGSTQEGNRVELKPIKLASLSHSYTELHSSRGASQVSGARRATSTTRRRGGA